MISREGESWTELKLQGLYKDTILLISALTTLCVLCYCGSPRKEVRASKKIQSYIAKLVNNELGIPPLRERRQ